MRERNLTFTQTLIFFACIFLLGLVIGLLFTSVDGLTNEDVCNRLYPNGTYAEVNSCILFFGSLNETVIQTNNMTQVYNMTNNITETVTNNITTTVLRSMDADFTEYYDKSQMDNKFSTLTVDIKDWTRDELREIQVTSPDSGSDIDNILKYQTLFSQSSPFDDLLPMIIMSQLGFGNNTDSCEKTDLSGYYTKSEVETKLNELSDSFRNAKDPQVSESDFSEKDLLFYVIMAIVVMVGYSKRDIIFPDKKADIPDVSVDQRKKDIWKLQNETRRGEPKSPTKGTII